MGMAPIMPQNKNENIKNKIYIWRVIERVQKQEKIPMI